MIVLCLTTLLRALKQPSSTPPAGRRKEDQARRRRKWEKGERRGVVAAPGPELAPAEEQKQVAIVTRFDSTHTEETETSQCAFAAFSTVVNCAITFLPRHPSANPSMAALTFPVLVSVSAVVQVLHWMPSQQTTQTDGGFISSYRRAK